MQTLKDKKAPIFNLKNTVGENVDLNDYVGKRNIVLLFFPQAFTGVCTKELCTVRDNLKLYDSLDAEILAISVDSHFTLKEFKQSQNINFQLLSDFNKEVSDKYFVLNNDFFGMKGVSKRSAFVIDKQGIVRYEEVLEDASMMPSFDNIQQVLVGLN
ncbi:MAG: redoxin domain-containing protein [Balneolaceae bacterium]